MDGNVSLVSAHRKRSTRPSPAHTHAQPPLSLSGPHIRGAHAPPCPTSVLPAPAPSLMPNLGFFQIRRRHTKGRKAATIPPVACPS